MAARILAARVIGVTGWGWGRYLCKPYYYRLSSPGIVLSMTDFPHFGVRPLEGTDFLPTLFSLRLWCQISYQGSVIIV